MEGWFSWRGVLCLFISLNWFSLVVDEDVIYECIYNIYINVNENAKWEQKPRKYICVKGSEDVV